MGYGKAVLIPTTSLALVFCLPAHATVAQEIKESDVISGIKQNDYRRNQYVIEKKWSYKSSY
jgi:hypothetical protein